MLPVDPSNMKGVQRFNKANLGERQKKMGNVNQQLGSILSHFTQGPNGCCIAVLLSSSANC